MRHGTIVMIAIVLLCACSPAPTTDGAAEVQPTMTSGLVRPTETTAPEIGVRVEADGGGDYASIQEAIDALPDGGTLHLGSGTYELDQPLEISKDINIRGDGQVTVSSSTAPYVAHFAGSHQFAVSDISFAYTGEGTASVLSITGGRLTLDGVHIQGASGTGEWENLPGGAHFTDSMGVVIHSTFENNTIGILLDGSANVAMDDVELYENGVGVMFKGDSLGRVRESNLSNSYGVWITGNAVPHIEGNVFSQVVECGVTVQQSGSGVVTENTFDGAGQAGICVEAQVSPQFRYYDNEFTAQTTVAVDDPRMIAALRNHEVLFFDDMSTQEGPWAPTNETRFRNGFWEMIGTPIGEEVLPGFLGLSVDYHIADNRAFMFDFAAVEFPWMELELLSDQPRPSPDSRCLGLSLHVENFLPYICEGMERINREYIGQFPYTDADSWHTALLAMDDAGEYRIYVRPRDGGDGYADYTVTLDESWQGQEWALIFTVFQGTVKLDNFYLLSFEGYQ